MGHIINTVAGVAALTALFIPEVAAQSCAGVSGRFQPRMGSGYRVSLLATGLRQPRHIVVDSAGNLLVAEGGAQSVRRLVLRDEGNIVCAQSNTQLSGTNTNHGIALSADGRTLFTSNLASVNAYSYDPATGQVGSGRQIVNGMSNTGTHPTRAIATSKWSPDTILVARGSQSNIDTTTTQTSAGRSMIKTFSISAGTQSTINYNTGGEVLGWGLRNIVGLTEDPAYGGIWSVENQMDDVRLNGRDIHNNNPAERLSYHGILNATTNRYKGLNYGYPSCVPAWDPQNVGINGLVVGSLFKPDSVPNANDCANRMTGRLHFHAHTAPLDVKFTANGTAAYIAFHGSWNRNPADGYRVMRVDFRNGDPVADVSSTTAQIPVMENSNVGGCPNNCFRPVGLAFDAKGRLFVSSDTSGEIYVIYGA
ncbi:soluble quino protein glucose/sorbosone dehydrogenase [Triangularia verruculosa]|uniref:Soluble quino protein glucose/sorbosone dehydrogenase n=1 Tax=Triangularia verruculosa TaxID=2587418 RepID=A0AAN6XHW8_9PEZI|nr:soluble quino protein glucose/sorbosone dehydrogenase [Triangularia verruculosa]